MVAAAIKTIFVQPDTEHIHRQLAEVAGTLRPQFPDVAEQLELAEESSQAV
jgi:transposase-like protein